MDSKREGPRLARWFANTGQALQLVVALIPAALTVYSFIASMHNARRLWLTIGCAITTVIAAFWIIFEASTGDHPYSPWVVLLSSALICVFSVLIGWWIAPARRRKGPESTLISREKTYEAIIADIKEAERENGGIKEFRIAALHGPSGARRTTTQAVPNPVLTRFEATIFECVRSRGSSMWRVYDLYNITTESRLDQIVARLRSTEAEEGYEARAFFEPRAFPILAPLCVDELSAYLGHEDADLFKVDSAMRSHGAAGRRLIRRYFDDLWNDPRASVIRAGSGIVWSNIELLRAKIVSRGEDNR